MSEATCDKEGRCSWDSVAKYMESRIFSGTDLDRICSTHIDASDSDGDNSL